MEKEEIVESIGSVFADLMASLREAIASRRWPQLQAAERLGIGQPCVSDLAVG